MISYDDLEARTELFRIYNGEMAGRMPPESSMGLSPQGFHNSDDVDRMMADLKKTLGPTSMGPVFAVAALGQEASNNSIASLVLGRDAPKPG